MLRYSNVIVSQNSFLNTWIHWKGQENLVYTTSELTRKTWMTCELRFIYVLDAAIFIDAIEFYCTKDSAKTAFKPKLSLILFTWSRKFHSTAGNSRLFLSYLSHTKQCVSMSQKLFLISQQAFFTYRSNSCTVACIT